jgi:hypothetical protein
MFAKIQSDIAERKSIKAARNKMEYAGTLKGVAQDNLDKEQWDQALDKIEATRQIIFELQQVHLLFPRPRPHLFTRHIRNLTSFLRSCHPSSARLVQLLTRSTYRL